MDALAMDGASQQGHTPQHVGLAIRRSRLGAIFGGSALVANMLSRAVNPTILIAAQPTRQVQRYAHLSAVHSLAAAEDYARRTRSPFGWTPWPSEFDVGREAIGQLQRGDRGVRT